MNAPAFPAPELAIPVEFQSCFAAQRAAYLKAPEPAMKSGRRPESARTPHQGQPGSDRRRHQR